MGCGWVSVRHWGQVNCSHVQGRLGKTSEQMFIHWLTAMANQLIKSSCCGSEDMFTPASAHWTGTKRGRFGVDWLWLGRRSPEKWSSYQCLECNQLRAPGYTSISYCLEFHNSQTCTPFGLLLGNSLSVNVGSWCKELDKIIGVTKGVCRTNER